MMLVAMTSLLSSILIVCWKMCATWCAVVGSDIETDPAHCFDLTDDCFLVRFEADLGPNQSSMGSACDVECPLLQLLGRVP